jgi:LysR family hydrogen peroxide-inducible transcriptional activator
VLVAAKRHPLATTPAPAKPSELRDASVLLLGDEHCFGKQALAFCSAANARDLEFRGTSLSTIAHMVVGGAGVTLLPELAVPTEARYPELCVRSFAEPAPSRTIGLVWRKSSTLTPALHKVAAVVRHAYPMARPPKGGQIQKKSRS